MTVKDVRDECGSYRYEGTISFGKDSLGQHFVWLDATNSDLARTLAQVFGGSQTKVVLTVRGMSPTEQFA